MLYKRSDGVGIRKWAKKHKVCYQTIYCGIQRGLSVDEACENATKRKGQKNGSAKYFVGKLTLRYYCEQNNISYKKIIQRVRKGASVKQALARN